MTKKGWNGESQRHGMSARRIKTGKSKYTSAMGQIKSETIQLREILSDLRKSGFDANHVINRWFRLMAEGSYHGQGYYHRILEQLEETEGNAKKLRSLAIQIMMDSLQAEFPEISRSTIQKNVVKTIGDDIGIWNKKLIEDLVDMAEAHEILWAKWLQPPQTYTEQVEKAKDYKEKTVWDKLSRPSFNHEVVKGVKELMKKENIDPEYASPNFVNDFAYNRGIKLSSDEVIEISNTYR